VPFADGGEKKKGTIFKVGDVTIEIDPKLENNWEFSGFKKVKKTTDTIEGITVYKGGKPVLYRWYGYDKDGVKIDDGPLDYQDYVKGEKTRFDFGAITDFAQIKVFKIKAK
jgi:hypothetical protein